MKVATRVATFATLKSLPEGQVATFLGNRYPGADFRVAIRVVVAIATLLKYSLSENDPKNLPYPPPHLKRTQSETYGMIHDLYVEI